MGDTIRGGEESRPAVSPETVERVGVAVRDVLEAAGEAGLSVRDFYNHDRLGGYSHTEIDKALRKGMNGFDIELGGAATRFFWIGE